MKLLFRPLLLFCAFLIHTPLLQASDFLEAFSYDPEAAYQLRPLKEGSRRTPRFSASDIQSGRFLQIKAEERQKIICRSARAGGLCDSDFEPQEAYTEDLRIRYFVGGTIDRNIFSAANISQGQVAKMPWAGFYWPLYMGGLGYRLGDSRFPQSTNFKKNYDYIVKNGMKPVGTSVAQLNLLSPAEKYDYLVDDRQWTMTRASWEDGKYYYDRSGKVETWMGLCHGWAAAALVVPEPLKSVDLHLPGNKGTLRILPDDLKGWITQLWSNARFNVEFMGGRCNEKNPRRDENGRLTEPQCFDMNPSAWHLVLTHLLGKKQQSFVLDVTYDYEVWNQPIYSYKLSYFNPNTKKTGLLGDSIIPYRSITKDPFRKYRSPNVAYLVGVVSEIQYVEENVASSDENRRYNPFDYLAKVSYYYDLELDKDYNILGGEWYQQEHPDMLWRPTDGVTAQHPNESTLVDWNGKFPLPLPLVNLAPQASKEKIPLSKILNVIIQQASTEHR